MSIDKRIIPEGKKKPDGKKKATVQSRTRYDVRLRTPDGGHLKRTFHSEKDALRYERSERSKLDRGDWIDPRAGDAIFETVALDWLRSNPGKRASTLARDRSAITKHLVPAVGKLRIRQITSKHVEEIVRVLAEKWSPRHTARVYGVLRAVLNYAVDRDIIARSPCRSIKLPRADRAAVHVFTPDELATLAYELGPDQAPMMWLGALLGLRWGEVAGLRVRSLDLLRRTVEVSEQQTRSGTIGPTKSDASRRTLAMPAALAEMLAAHLAARGLTAEDAGALVFVTTEGTPLSYVNWRRRVWCPAIAAAGLGTFERVRVPGKTERQHSYTRDRYTGPGFHDLRRTNATGLVVEGVDVKTAQARLGHSDPRLTLSVYAQAVTAADRDAADRIGERLMPAPATALRTVR